MIEPWPVGRGEELYRNRIFSVRGEWCTDPRDGTEHCFWHIGTNDWVNVVALTEDGRYVLVEQWRAGAQEVSLELAGGVVEPGEDPRAAGARELLEETGYVAGPMTALGHVSPNPALFRNRSWIFAARLCRPARPEERLAQDHTENLETRVVTPAELDALVAGGRIRHAVVLAALLKHRLAR